MLFLVNIKYNLSIFRQRSVLLDFLNNSSIKKITFLLIVFSGIFTFAFAFLVIFNEKIELTENIEKTKNKYIREKKDIIISQSSKIYNIIEYYESQNSINIANILSKIFKEPLKETFSFVLKDDKVIYETLELSSFDDENERLFDNILKLKSDKSEFFRAKYKGKNTIIYVKKFRKKAWIVGTGVFLDDFESMILKQKDESKYKITSFVLKIITLTFMLYGISIMKYRYLARKLQDELVIMNKFFTQASKTYNFIDLEQIHLEEFKEIATHANSMLATIKTNTEKLKSLNANLENIIADKTSKLTQSIELSNRLLKDQDRFINNAIHEINTPLSVILLNTEMYHLKYEQNPYLNKIQVAVKVLETINEDLSYIAKKDRTSYVKSKLNLSEILSSRVEYFCDIAKQNELGFDVSIDEGVNVFFNEIELIRILDNNLSNSIKYAHEKTKININLISKNNTAKFIISNKSDEIKSLEKLFSRFYRENEATGGFGLGLNIVKEICDKNGVKIKLNSKDKSTTFEYEFEQI